MINLREQLKIDEGVRFKPYKDSVGILTVGVGRNLQDVAFSQEEIELMLSTDINRAVISCKKIFPKYYTFNQSRREALANMCFNLGETRLRGFTHMVAAINKGDWAQAAVDAHHSKWFEQVGKRAVRIIAAFGVEE